MIIWIERPLVLAIHDRQLAEHGGGSGVRDDALLDSALARPKQLSAYGDPSPDLAAPTASLAYGLARHHPFVDGNKRTAAVACETFIVLNGATLLAGDLELYGFFISAWQMVRTMRQRVQHGYVHGCNPGTSSACMSQHRTTVEIGDLPPLSLRSSCLDARRLSCWLL